MSSRAEFRARVAGAAAAAALREGTPATVFAAFERSFYVETASGIACIGGADIGRGPLNVIVEGPLRIPAGSVNVDIRGSETWIPPSIALKEKHSVTLLAVTGSWRHHREVQSSKTQKRDKQRTK